MVKKKELVGEPATKEQIKNLGYRIYKLFKKHDMWMDAEIYFNGCCLSTMDKNNVHHYDGSMYIHVNKKPKDKIADMDSEHNLVMFFDGPIYHMFNYGNNRPVLKEFNALLKTFGFRYELIDGCSLVCFPIERSL